MSPLNSSLFLNIPSIISISFLAYYGNLSCNISRYVIFHISHDEWHILYHMGHINFDITERVFCLHLDSADHQLVACDITIPSISDACLENSFKNFWRSSPELSSISLWLLQAAPNFAFRTEIKISSWNDICHLYPMTALYEIVRSSHCDRTCIAAIYRIRGNKQTPK